MNQHTDFIDEVIVEDEINSSYIKKRFKQHILMFYLKQINIKLIKENM